MSYNPTIDFFGLFLPGPIAFGVKKTCPMFSIGHQQHKPHGGDAHHMLHHNMATMIELRGRVQKREADMRIGEDRLDTGRKQFMLPPNGLDGTLEASSQDEIENDGINRHTLLMLGTGMLP